MRAPDLELARRSQDQHTLRSSELRSWTAHGLFKYADQDRKYALLTHAVRYTGIPGALSFTQARVTNDLGLNIHCIDKPAAERPRSRRRLPVA